MRWIAFRQRRRALGGQHVNAASLIHAACVRVIPGPLTQRDHARYHARGHFGLDMHFTAIVKNADPIAIGDTALLCIKRVDPHLLTAGGFQYVNVAVGGVRAGFLVKTGQLQRIFFRQRIVIVFKPRAVYRQRVDNILFFQLPGRGNFRQLRRVDFNFP